MSRIWLTEILFAGMLLAAALVIGLATGFMAAAIGVSLMVYLFWHLYNIERLLHMLRIRTGIASAPGIWGELFAVIQKQWKVNERRERRLSTTIELFEDSAAALPDATVSIDKRGRIEWCNEAAFHYLGLAIPQDSGRVITNMVRHPDFVKYYAVADFEATVEFPSPVDQEMSLLARMVPYSNNRRLLVVRDVTRLRHLEKVRRDFVANASHELRTPLSVIHGFLDAMSCDRKLCPKEWERPMAQMLNQTDRMQNIVSDMLSVAKVEDISTLRNMAPVDVCTLLYTIEGEIRTLSAEKQHEIELEVDPTLWMKGDRGELNSAFSNLIFNAVRYTPSYGKISVRWYADSNGPHFAVIDNGPGIQEQHIPRLTERFYRVDTGRSRDEGGTGLGLAIVRHVVNRHGGELFISSKPGDGSTFRCDFPPEMGIRRESVTEQDRQATLN